MQYLTLNTRDETIERICYVESIKENLIDAMAELEEVKKRNPLVHTKSMSESSGYRGSEAHSIAVIFDAKEKALERQIMNYKSIIYDYEKGLRLLDEQEKELLVLRYKKNMTQLEASYAMGYSISRIKQLNASLINKMQNQIVWY